MDFRNGAKMRKNNDKAGPSGMSRNTAFSMPDRWGGRNCLIPVDVNVIREIKETMGGDALLAFVTPDFDKQAQKAFDKIGISHLTMDNAWAVFAAMLPVLYPAHGE